MTNSSWAILVIMGYALNAVIVICGMYILTQDTYNDITTKWQRWILSILYLVPWFYTLMVCIAFVGLAVGLVVLAARRLIGGNNGKPL